MSDTCCLFPVWRPLAILPVTHSLPGKSQKVTCCERVSMAQWGTAAGQEVRVRSGAEGEGEREGPGQGDLL